VVSLSDLRHLHQILNRLRRALASPPAGIADLSERFLFLEKEVIIPAKALVLGLLAYYLFFSQWASQASGSRDVVVENVQGFFPFYVGMNVLQALLMYLGQKRLSISFMFWMVFTVNLVDGFFFSSLAVATSGFDGVIFWIFPILIVRNALTINLGTSQIALNVMVTVFYLAAGLVDLSIRTEEAKHLSYFYDRLPKAQNKVSRAKRENLPSKSMDVHLIKRLLDEDQEGEAQEETGEGLLLRLTVLWLMTGWCYGLQLLVLKQRQTDAEVQEYGIRQEQLQTAGRLAAEIAHKLKNPLGIINNAAFSLQRGLQEQKPSMLEQIGIIREEVERADRILTELMGYAQLAEGKVERVDVAEVLDQAVCQVFPPGANYSTEIVCNYNKPVPTLLMQRAHLLEVFMNLLQNAREAMNGEGKIEISATAGPDYYVNVEIRDNGPGISEEKLEKVFEPYFTTKEKGTGLGLAIVKHNTELYGGAVTIESGLGKGTCFQLRLPAKPMLRLRK